MRRQRDRCKDSGRIQSSKEDLYLTTGTAHVPQKERGIKVRTVLYAADVVYKSDNGKYFRIIKEIFLKRRDLYLD